MVSVASEDLLLITHIAASGKNFEKSSIVDAIVSSSLYAGNTTAILIYFIP
jgi:hypothetical protein